MARPARVSPDRILAAAAIEFARRGFTGARVDRIARRARVNKAMLYYHFRNKQDLYRTLLRRTFADAGLRLQRIADGRAAPAEKIDQTLAAIAAFVQEQTYFPAILLREIAEGGVHLDGETLGALVRLPLIVSRIVREGVAARSFRSLHPLTAYFTMVAPIVFFLAGAPVRQALAARHADQLPALELDTFLRQFQETIRLGFAPPSQPETMP